MVFSPDGEKIASILIDNKIEIYNNLTRISVFKGNRDKHINTNSITFSSDGKRIALFYEEENNILIWDIEDNKLLTTINKNISDRNSYFVFSPNSKSLITANSSNVEIYNTETGKHSNTIQTNSTITECAFSSDNKKIAIALEDGSIQLYECNDTIKCIDTLYGHKSSLLRFNPNNQYLINISCDDNTTEIWNTSNHKYTIRKYRFFISHDWKKQLRGHFDKMNNEFISVTDINFKPLYNLTKYTKHIYSKNIFAAEFSPDDKFIILGINDIHIEIYDATNGKYINSLPIPSQTNQFSISNEYLTVSLEPSLLWSISSLLYDNGYDYNITSIYDIRSCKLLTTLSGISNAKLSPDGTKLFGMQDGVYKLWKFPSLEELVERTRKQFRNRELTEEEKKAYYLTN